MLGLQGIRHRVKAAMRSVWNPDPLIQQLSELTALLELVAARVEAVETRLAGLESRSTAAESLVAPLPSRLAQVEAGLGRIGSRATASWWKIVHIQETCRRSDRVHWEKIGDLRAFDRKVYSQSGEDGIIAEIVRRVGVRHPYFVEFGVESGIECNCARLVLDENWKGLFIEGDSAQHEKLAARYRGYPGVRCLNEYVSSANIEQILARNDVPEDLDLLSIDIDGNDYWVWAAIARWHPSIVVIEYNAAYPPPQRWVMKENPHHRWNGTNYYGASLASLAALGRRKGYALVATNPDGVNAFFVRDDLIADRFLDPAAHWYYSPVGGGHPPGQGPFVKI